MCETAIFRFAHKTEIVGKTVVPRVFGRIGETTKTVPKQGQVKIKK